MAVGIMEPLTLRPPSLRECRDGRTLLVWGELPRWLVADGELAALLDAFAESATLAAVLAAHPDWPARQARQLVKQFQQDGLLSVGPPAPVAPPPMPQLESVAINLTRACNLQCSFCYHRQEIARPTAAPLAIGEIEGFLDRLRPYLAKQPALTILGGEPTLDPDLLLAVSRAGRRRGYTTLVATNGTRITADFAHEAARAKLQVQVSLDGPTAALHDAIRGEGAFAAAVDGIRRLVAAKAYVLISMVCHRGNVDALADYYRLGVELGVREVRYIPLKRVGGGNLGACEPVPMPELLARGATLFREHPEWRRLAGRDALSIFANSCRYGVARQSCGTGVQTLLLDADGSLYPCLNLDAPAFRFGNLRDPGFSFDDSWQSSPALATVRKATALGSGACGRCPVRAWCLGGCHGETHACFGKLDRPAWNCADLRRAVLDMCWLLADEPALVRPNSTVC